MDDAGDEDTKRRWGVLNAVFLVGNKHRAENMRMKPDFMNARVGKPARHIFSRGVHVLLHLELRQSSQQILRPCPRVLLA